MLTSAIVEEKAVREDKQADGQMGIAMLQESLSYQNRLQAQFGGHGSPIPDLHEFLFKEHLPRPYLLPFPKVQQNL